VGCRAAKLEVHTHSGKSGAQRHGHPCDAWDRAGCMRWLLRDRDIGARWCRRGSRKGRRGAPAAEVGLLFRRLHARAKLASRGGSLRHHRIVRKS
jgi:hypothetical protein